MNTEKNGPDDETQPVETGEAVEGTAEVSAVDETPDITTQDAVDTTQPLPAAESQALLDPAPPAEPEQIATAVAADGPVIEDRPVLEPEPEPQHVTAEAADPFAPFIAAPVPSVAAAPEPAVLTDPEPARRRLRVGTVVWGLILAAFGLGVIAWASGARIDFQLALIVLLAVAGTALLVGSILSGARHARR